MNSGFHRREFLKIFAGAGVASAVPTSTPVSSKMIGIQVGAVSFVDEGAERVLDVLQQLILSRKYSEMRLANISDRSF